MPNEDHPSIPPVEHEISIELRHLTAEAERLWREWREHYQQNDRLGTEMHAMIQRSGLPDKSIYEGLGGTYKALIATIGQIQELAAKANDCFEDLEFLAVKFEWQTDENTGSILQEWRTTVSTSLPPFSPEDLPLSEPGAFTQFLLGIARLAKRGLRQISLNSTPAKRITESEDARRGNSSTESDLASALKRERKRLGIAQKAIAHSLGMTQSQISRIERGERNLTDEQEARVRQFLERSKSDAPPRK